RELYFYRERTAASLDRAPFRVLPEPLLVRLAAELPRTLADLPRVHGMTPYLFEHHSRELLECIARGLRAQPVEKLPQHPVRGGWDGATSRRYEALRAWRKKTALERGVEPVVILETDEMKALAAAPSKSEDPSDWLASLSTFKAEAYRADLLRMLKETVPSAKPRHRRRGTPPIKPLGRSLP
ncbi:MAG: HRDC domain-containing protein, partial [candidate division NC10 bacterium]